MSTSTNPAKDSRKQGKDAGLDKALEDTFPASDPVAAETPTKPGTSRKRH